MVKNNMENLIVVLVKCRKIKIYHSDKVFWPKTKEELKSNHNSMDIMTNN